MTKTRTRSKAERKAEASKRPTFVARHMFANITARKARLLADLVRGQPVNRALVMLDRSPQRAAVLVAGVVRSAVANAEQKALAANTAFDVDRLMVTKAIVNEGQTLKRIHAAAQGRATPIRKRTSHVEIHVDAKKGKA